jgi:hypothetical protein
MTQLDEVLQFSREYINKPKLRTAEQRIKIRDVYKQLTGDVVNPSCGSCYIAALLKIIKLNKKKMAHSDYVLKPGAILQAFGDASKIATNKNLTNELAEWYIKNVPGSLKKFSKMPAGVVVPEFTGITIVKNNIVQPEKIVIPDPEVIAPVKVEPEIVIPKKAGRKPVKKYK